jgi:hypothetical protein
MKSLLDSKEEQERAAPTTLQKRMPLQVEPHMVRTPPDAPVEEPERKVPEVLPRLPNEEWKQIYAPEAAYGSVKVSKRINGSAKKLASADSFAELRKEKYLKNIKSYQHLKGPEHASTGPSGAAFSSDPTAETSGQVPESSQRAPRKPSLLTLPALDLRSVSSQ